MSWIIRTSGERGHGARARPSVGRGMPAQKPGKSNQVVGTPWELIDAVEKRFGPLVVDLAAVRKNAKAPTWISPSQDSLSIRWTRFYEGNMWLNPPFGDIKPWARKCAKEAKRLKPGSLILLLVPASVGSNWYSDFVHDKALVHPLKPRVKFEGHTQAFPKDLILACYGLEPGFVPWDWKLEGVRHERDQVHAGTRLLQGRQRPEVRRHPR